MAVRTTTLLALTLALVQLTTAQGAAFDGLTSTWNAALATISTVVHQSDAPALRRRTEDTDSGEVDDRDNGDHAEENALEETEAAEAGDGEDIPAEDGRAGWRALPVIAGVALSGLMVLMVVVVTRNYTIRKQQVGVLEMGTTADERSTRNPMAPTRAGTEDPEDPQDQPIEIRRCVPQ